MKKLFLFSITLLLVYPLTLALPVRADWLIDRSGTLIQVDGAILGDDDSTDEIEVETDDQDDDNDSEESIQRPVEIQREAEQQRLERSRETLKNQIEVRKTMQEKTGDKSRVEIRNEAGQLKLKQELKDEKGRLIRKQEVEIKSGDALHVEQEGGETVRINAVKDGRMELIKNRVKASSDFEIKIGEKNEISVTLPNGKMREVALPDKALEKLVANGVITQTEGEENAYALTAGKNGDPVYEVEGQVEKKIFGIFRRKFSQKMAVAAGASDDGTVVAGDVVETESQETGWRRFWERLAI